MNFVMISHKVRRGVEPIHRWELARLLSAFGIEPETNWRGHRHMFGKWAKRSLWDLWEMVQARWKMLRRQLHPDVSRKHHDVFATISHIYDTIMLRFKTKGIG